MDRKETSAVFWFKLTFLVIIATIISIHFLDTGVAARIMIIIRSIRPLHTATENIPDFLSAIVVGGTILMWIIYLFRFVKKKIDVKEKFLRLAATTLPLSYLIKMMLQIIFGRISPRDWLIHHESPVFKFFNFHGGGSFPSGHMTVFVAFGTSLILYFPKFRKLVTIILALLAFALIATDYHFISDVIAGAYLGFGVTYTLWYLYERNNEQSNDYS